MSIPQQVGRISANVETATRADEFAALAKFIMASGGVSKATAPRRVPRATETWDRASLEF